MGKFDLGRVLSRLFGMIRSGFGTTGLFLLAIAVLTQALSAVMRAMLFSGTSGNPADPAAALGVVASPYYWLTMAVITLLGSVGYAGGMAGYLAQTTGKPMGFGQSLGIGITRMLPVTLLFVLWMFAVILGSILLLVPGLMLMTIWSVAVPAMVNERIGPFAAFGRSRELTSGSRWMIFLTLVVILLLVYVPITVFGGVVAGMVGLSGLTRMSQGAISPAILVSGTLIGWGVSMILNAGLASLYVETVEAKGGEVSETLAEVFN